MTYIGDEIRRTRTRAGMTSKALAEQTKLSQQYVGDVQLGRRLPSMETMLVFCNVFPDADSARWAWLMLTDLYGQPMVDMLWAYARRGFGAAIEDDSDGKA